MIRETTGFFKVSRVVMSLQGDCMSSWGMGGSVPHFFVPEAELLLATCSWCKSDSCLGRASG